MKDKNIIFIDKAISVENTKTSFYYSIRCDGSSLNETKISNGININNKFDVECVNIVEFINNLNLNSNDKLWVKMDVEGEEYKLIPHLHNYNLLKRIDKLFIEWHHEKIKNIDISHHKYCKSLLTNIEEHYWDALSYSIKNINEDYKLFIKNNFKFNT